MKCPNCKHPDTSHNDAGCFHDDGQPCFCRTSGEQIRFPEQYDRPHEEVVIPRSWYFSISPSVLSAVFMERKRQNEKWGEQNHDAYRWLAILSEEVGEAAQAALHNEFGGRAKGTLWTELVQVAAVAIQWLECIDRHRGEE